MSSSRSAIDEALSPDDLEDLSKIMFGDQTGPASPGSSSNTESSRSGLSVRDSPDREKPSSEAGASSPGSVPEAEWEEAESERDAPKETAPPKADEASSKRKLKRNAGGSSSSRKTSQAEGSSRTEVERPVERPSFTIYADQAATLRVLAGSKADPLGTTASEIAGRALDLLGYNGRHPAAALHGQTLSDNASAPGPLIEERQWEALLLKADEMVASLDEGSLNGDSLDEDEARLACVCYLVQEALYEAGFGDRRRRRKGPL